MGLLDWIIGCFCFLPNSDVAVYYSSQGRFLFFLRHILPKCYIWSKKVISGPDFLKNDDIWSNFIKLDQIGSTLVSASSRNSGPPM